MDKVFVPLIFAMVVLNSSWIETNTWLAILFAIAAFIYFAYNMGYQSGKDRALRDNRNDFRAGKNCC